MDILNPQHVAQARATAVRLQTSYGLKEIEQRANAILASQGPTEAAYLASAEAVQAANERVYEVKEAVKAREGEILNDALGAGAHITQEIEAAKDAMKDREEEIAKEIEAETVTIQVPNKGKKGPDDPENVPETKPRYMTATGRKTELGQRKKSDAKLSELKATLKALEAQKVDPQTAGEKSRLVAKLGADDAELAALRAALAQAEAERAQRIAEANAAKVAFNGLQRDYHLTLRLLEMKAATMRVLAGYEHDAPAPTPVQTTIPAHAAATVAQPVA